MPYLIDVHCHLLNFQFVPDPFFNAHAPIRLKSRAPVREWLLRLRPTGWLAEILALWPTRKYNHLGELLALLRKDMNEVADALNREMQLPGLPDAEIMLATPLMMDLEAACLSVAPEFPYRYQVKLMAEVAARHPGRLMPFIMFDPRRRSAGELVIKALEQLGFLGVKMYPALGHHPDPNSLLNEPAISEQLAMVYAHCQDHQVPITTHCSRGGAYSGDLIRCRPLVHEFSQPSSWQGVLRTFPNLRVNFAHFGGKFLEFDNPRSWCSQILRLMREYEYVYADLAYHDALVQEKASPPYWDALRTLVESELYRKRILFGTDWLMIRHTWSVEDYVRPFLHLPKLYLLQIAFKNPLDFLFPQRELPNRLVRFYQSRDLAETALPPWMSESLSWSWS